MSLFKIIKKNLYLLLVFNTIFKISVLIAALQVNVEKKSLLWSLLILRHRTHNYTYFIKFTVPFLVFFKIPFTILFFQ